MVKSMHQVPPPSPSPDFPNDVNTGDQEAFTVSRVLGACPGINRPQESHPKTGMSLNLPRRPEGPWGQFIVQRL